MEQKKQYATEEQLVYAGWLNIGMMIGFVLLLGTFVVYLLGIAPPHVPVDDLPRYWTMPVKEYLKAANVHTGWSWLTLAGKGDFMNFLGIAFLSAVTTVCFARIVPILFRNGDKVYGTIAVTEILVLVLAASGILAAGH
jgi:hypothetical protein